MNQLKIKLKKASRGISVKNLQIMHTSMTGIII